VNGERRTVNAEVNASSTIGREHGVDNYTGHGDVEPNRESPSGQASVRGKTTAEREKKRDQNHRQGHHRETDVRDEQREIDVTNSGRTLKVHVAVEGVIGDIGDEKKGRKNKCREHGCSVLADALCPDEVEAGDEGDGREGVEERVECRKEEQMGPCNVGRRMIIDEPAEEKAGPGADADNGGDDAKRRTVLVGGEQSRTSIRLRWPAHRIARLGYPLARSLRRRG
jgi:hypothetical protein